MPLGWRKAKVDMDNLIDAIKFAPVEAMQRGAEVVASDARRMCVSSEVRATIRVTGLMKSRKKGNPMIQVQAGDASTIVGTTDKFQLARIIEYGTHGGAKSKGPPQMAKPFMRPAWRHNKAGILKEMRAAIRTAIKASCKGPKNG